VSKSEEAVSSVYQRSRKDEDYSPDGRVNPSEIGYSPDDRADLPNSPDGTMTKLIKPKCPNTSHM